MVLVLCEADGRIDGDICESGGYVEEILLHFVADFECGGAGGELVFCGEQGDHRGAEINRVQAGAGGGVCAVGGDLVRGAV